MSKGKSITEFVPHGQPTGDELLLVNKSTNDGFVSKKMKLSTLADYIVSYINESGIADEPNDPVPIGGRIHATVTTNQKTATCSNVDPADSIVQVSTTDATSGYANGTEKTLTFSAGATQTKKCWFKITHDGYLELIYQAAITQTASSYVSGSTPIYEWKSVLEPSSGAYTPEQKNARVNQLNAEGSDNVRAIVVGASHYGKDGYYISYQRKTLTGYSNTYSYTYTYSGVVTEVTP